MANQTITTAVNYDDASISGLLNGETITNNGGALTINSDVRWNQQAAVLGNITCSGTLGGSVLVDGTTVWELAFTSSTGTVPTQAALGSNGVTGVTSAATGELMRVWATGSLTFAAAGGAMPATGFIKLRTKTGTFQTGETVNLPGGATIVISSAGKRSWIHVVGSETTSISASRLSSCSFTGDWYELGTTNGTDGQTFQFPVADYCPAIQIETSVGSGVYEWWLYGADGVRWGTATQYISTDVRGKYFGMDATTGVITIARRATNSCGYKPASGLKVRIPNIICSSSNSTNFAINTWNTTTITQRYRGISTSTNNASASYDKICCNWALSMSTGTNVTITNSSLMPSVSIATLTGAITIDNVAVGASPANFASTNTILIQSVISGTISNLRVTRLAHDSNADVAINMVLCFNVTITNVQGEIFGATGSVSRVAASSGTSFLTSRCGLLTINTLTAIGATPILNTCISAVTINGIIFADCLNGTTQTATSTSNAVNIITSTNLTLNGPVSFFGGLSNIEPFSALISGSTANTNVVIQNIGSSASPLNLNNNSQYIFNFSSTNGLIVRRCYVQNTRTNLGVLSSDVARADIDNCAGDYADLMPLTGANCRWRGSKTTNSTTSVAAMIGTEYGDMFTSATTGRIIFTGNEGASGSSDLVLSVGAGGGYSGSGNIIMPNLNDTATWEYSYFLLGHNGFQNTAPTITGTNTTNFTIDFQYDTGTGWNGAWLSATGANLSGLGAINPATGIKLKVRATVNTASASNALAFIRIDTNTSATDQDTLYPFPYDGTGVIGNLLSGSRIQIYNQTTSTELVNTTVSATSYSYSYYVGTQVSAGNTVRIRVAKLGQLPQSLLAIATSTGFSATANALADSIYVSNGIDGSTVTEFAADYPNIQMDITDPDGATTVQRVYAWLRFNETTSQGIAQWFNGVTPTDTVNYLIDTTIINMQLDNRNVAPVKITGGRLYRSDNATIIASLSNSIQMDPSRVYLGDGISPNQTTYNNLADTFLRRSTTNIETSTFGDALSVRSMYGMVAQGTHNTFVNNSNKLVITKSDESTVLGTRTITNSADAQPIIGLDSD